VINCFRFDFDLRLYSTDDIVCLAMHPDREIMATGQVGKDPSICVWYGQVDIYRYAQG